MALTGFSFGNVCYSSLALANDAYFQSHPVALTAGATSYQVDYIKTGLVWYVRVSTISSTGKVTIKTPVVATAPVLPPCDPYVGFNDGLAYGSLLVGLLVAASVWGIISRAR